MSTLVGKMQIQTTTCEYVEIALLREVHVLPELYEHQTTLIPVDHTVVN